PGFVLFPGGGQGDRRQRPLGTLRAVISDSRCCAVARRVATAMPVVAALLAAAALLSAPGVAIAQSTTGSISGVVLTPDGAPVPGAVVEARSDETGTVRGAMTDAAGRYRFDLLTPGPWTLSAHVGDGPTGVARR